VKFLSERKFPPIQGRRQKNFQEGANGKEDRKIANEGRKIAKKTPK